MPVPRKVWSNTSVVMPAAPKHTVCVRRMPDHSSGTFQLPRVRSYEACPAAAQQDLVDRITGDERAL
jgi:hypothetical protein